METKVNNLYYLGFDLGGTSLKYGYGNNKEGLLFFNSKQHEEKTIEDLKKSLKASFDEMLKKANEDGYSIKAIGMGTPGIIDSEQGLVIGSTPNLKYLKGINLKDIFSEITDLPVVLENDANLMTYSEASLSTEKCVLGITLGSGIGTGFVDNFLIFKGEQNMALQAGHMIVKPTGRLCLCGKKGCLEAYCSAESIKKMVSDQLPEFKTLSLNDIFKHNDFRVKLIIRELLDILSFGISNLIVILNPGAVVIGGGVAECDAFDFKYVKNQINLYLSREYKNVIIRKAKNGNKAGVIGAIMLANNVLQEIST